MKFWKKEKIVVELGSKGLTVGEQRFDFPQEVVANLEIIDGKRFGEILDSFLIVLKGQRKVVLALAKEVVFTKTFEGKYSLVMDGDIKKFLDSVPLLPEKIARKIESDETKTTVWATNRELYAAVVNAISKYGVKVERVVPVGETTNFLIGKEEFDLETGGFNIKRLGVIFGIAFGVVMIAFLGKIILTRPADKVPTPVATQVEEEKKEPKIEYKSLRNIKVSVLNGTGAPGVAGKTAKILEGLGYIGVTTGNAKLQNETETKITAINQVSPEAVLQIKEALEKIFEKVVIVATGSAAVDILVVTGR